MKRSGLDTYTSSQANALLGGVGEARPAIVFPPSSQQHPAPGTAECGMPPHVHGGRQGIAGGLRTLSFDSQEEEPLCTPLPTAQVQKRLFHPPTQQQSHQQHGHNQYHSSKQQQQQQQPMQFQPMDPSRRMTAGTPELGFSRVPMAPPPSSSRQPFGAAAPPRSSSRFSMASSGLSTPASSVRGEAQNAPRLSMAPQASGQNGPRPSMGTARKAGKKAGDKPAPSKAQQQVWCQKILQFLTERKCNDIPQQLLSPTNKEFLNVFTFLAKLSDPTFALGAKPEEDVYQQTKRMAYTGSLSKAQIVSATIPHVWPHVLAMLFWMMEYARFSEHVQKLALAQTSMEFLVTSKVSQAHLAEESGDLDARDQTYHELVGQLNHGIGQYQQELDEATERNAMLRAQVQDIESKPSPLEQITAEKDQVAHDVRMLEEAIGELANEKKAMKESESALNERQAAAKQELAAVKQGNEEVRARVAGQSVQLPEFQRMLRERREREEKLRGVKAEVEEAQGEKWQAEVEATREGKALQDAAQAYTQTATRLHLLPPGARRAGGLDFSVSLSLHASKWDQILGNPHGLKGEVRKWAQQVLEEHNKAGAECERETIPCEAELARLQAEAESLRAEHVAAQGKLQTLDADMLAERERSRLAVEAMKKDAAEAAVQTEKVLLGREEELRRLEGMAEEVGQMSEAAALVRKREEEAMTAAFQRLQREGRASIVDVDAKLKGARALAEKEVKLPILEELFEESGIRTDN